MSSNEEYLDNLLKTMNDTDNSNRTMTPEEIEAMFAAAEEMEEAGMTLGEQIEPMPESVTEAEDTQPAQTQSAQAEDALTTEDTAEMSQDDIERLLEQAIAESEKPEGPTEIENNDTEVDEINELLRKADNDEVIDEEMLAMPEETEVNPFEEVNPEEIPEKQESKKKKREKKPREKKPREEKIREKKEPGKLSKLLAFWTEEDEEEPQIESELASNSEENEAILRELNKEDKSAKKKKKKAKNVEADETLDEEVENTDKKKGKKKEKKAPKPKKEKKAAPLEEKQPGKKVSGKRIFIIALVCLTIMAIIFICCVFFSKAVDVRAAKKAFYQGDYTQCYQLLYGKELNESETIIFEKSEVILSMERRLEAYENYLLMGKGLEALDSLIQATKIYDSLYEKATSLNILEEVTAIYERILKELDEKYQVSEKKARELAAYEDATQYTNALKQIEKERENVGAEAGTQTETPSTPLEDVLPREEELEDFNFVE